MPSIHRSFHVGDILAVLMDHELSLRGPAGAAVLQDYLVGRELNSRERMLYKSAIQDALRDQFWDLMVFQPEELPPRELVYDWLRRREQEFGAYFAVLPMETRSVGDEKLRHRSDGELLDLDERESFALDGPSKLFRDAVQGLNEERSEFEESGEDGEGCE